MTPAELRKLAEEAEIGPTFSVSKVLRQAADRIEKLENGWAADRIERLEFTLRAIGEGHDLAAKIARQALEDK